ncbi:MAG TPA: SDR family oxidoreductase [Methylomirabilota bacterium]|jgi:NAD(P)-dependent dehydrogenase (short-subunit alcohol dehydrogenase family)|nr:SDR family oxidoreductase [Methylomirabilota bacterium]
MAERAGELSGKVALITGGGRGIGAAVAMAYARAGADLVLASRTDADLVAVANAARAAGATVHAVSADVAEAEQVERVVRSALKTFGRIDVLVNNAGVGHKEVPTWQLEPGDWDRTIAVNLRGPYLLARAVLPHLLDRRQGSVINVSSICGSVPYANYGAYTASKFGLEGLTRVLAEETKRTGVRVNAVDPGLVATRMTDFQGAKPERVTGVFVYLASDASRRITGRTLRASRWRSEIGR